MNKIILYLIVFYQKYLSVLSYGKQLNLKFTKIKVKYWKVPVDQNYCLILQHNTKWDT